MALIFTLFCVIMAICSAILYNRKRLANRSNMLVKRELGRFRATKGGHQVRASELSQVIKKLDANALNTRRVHFDYYDNDRVVQAQLLDVHVYARCNLMEYMDLTRLIDATLRRAGF